jgi:hypothetical protein
MDETQRASTGISRRHFFGYAAALTGVGLLASNASCKKEDGNGDDRVYLGSGNRALMNFIYAIEQLQAAFYLKAIERPYTGVKVEELELLQQLRDHELVHRGFLKVLLGSEGIPELTAFLDKIDFTDRYSVLSTARLFKDTSVAAYNGVARLMDSSVAGQNYLSHLSKMASVEARHSAIIRELLEPDSFANTAILDPVNRTDAATSPDKLVAYVRR